jgi:hypothetical protein
MYPLDQAWDVLHFYDEFAGGSPDELGLLAVVSTLPDGTKAVVILLGYNGPIEKGEDVLRPLRAFGEPLADQISVMPYAALQSIVENFNPRGMRNYWKAMYLNQLDKKAIDVIVDQYADVPHPLTHSVIYTLGGAVARRTAVEDTAVAYRNSRHAFIVIGIWSDPAQDDQVFAYVRRYWGAMQPYASGGFYPNYEADLTPTLIGSGFDSARYERLVALKNKYDPTNFFRLNQNIKPTIEQREVKHAT